LPHSNQAKVSSPWVSTRPFKVAVVNPTDVSAIVVAAGGDPAEPEDDPPPQPANKKSVGRRMIGIYEKNFWFFMIEGPPSENWFILFQSFWGKTEAKVGPGFTLAAT